MHVCVLREQRPVEPIDFVVLTIGVVVAVLRSPNFIAHQEHRDAKREQRDRHEILNLAVSESLDSRIVGGALDATVPASIVVRAVAVILPVGFVVFVDCRRPGR